MLKDFGLVNMQTNISQSVYTTPASGYRIAPYILHKNHYHKTYLYFFEYLLCYNFCYRIPESNKSLYPEIDTEAETDKEDTI